MKNPTPRSGKFGAIVLAAYKPDPTLFERQLRSIQDQTHSNFVCQITADGGEEEVRGTVEKIVGRDERFVVLGFEERLGFYGNFERGLKHVPETAEWVALSDQDDYWHTTKLEIMLPYLHDNVLVAAQARVVDDTGRLIEDSTARRTTSFLHLLVQNQVTGGIAIFRRTLLDKALPFPQLHTMTQVHDHWLAVCAASSGSIKILDTVVQDYVQHGGNVIGEAVRGFHPLRSYNRAKSLARSYEGDDSPAAIGQLIAKMTYGWRRVMTDALTERFSFENCHVREARATFGPRHRWSPTIKLLLVGAAIGDVSLPFLLTFLAGIPYAVKANKVDSQSAHSEEPRRESQSG